MSNNGFGSFYLANNNFKRNIPNNLNKSVNAISYYPYNNTNIINNPLRVNNNNNFYQINPNNNSQIIYSNNIPNNNYITNNKITNPVINNIPIIYTNNHPSYVYTINNQHNLINNNIFTDYSTKPNSSVVIESYQPVIKTQPNINTQYDLSKFGINSNNNLSENRYGIIKNNKDLYSEFYYDNINDYIQELNVNKKQVFNIDNNLQNQTKANINSNISNNNLGNQIVSEENTNQNNLKIFQITKKEIQKRNLTLKDYENIHISGIGMINIGNTCFINSSLQVLIHCKLFIHAFFNKFSLINKQTTPISYQFLLICISILDNDNTKERYIDISDFKEAFGQKHPTFQGFSQNDSQEFCRVFLEDLSMELNEAKNKNVYKSLTNSEGKSKIVRDREFDLNFKEREESIITKLFYSQMITTFICQCGSEIYSFQKILDYPLLLPSNIKEINIYDLFRINFRTEIIDFSSKCERCKKIAKHKKFMRISRPPEILIISLQRIDSKTQLKNECLVNFPENLNLNEFIDQEIGFNKESEYKLFSVINHQGMVEYGHYFSYIQPFLSKNWYEFNDSSVSHIKEFSNIFPNAYVLFYIKKKYLTNKTDIKI